MRALTLAALLTFLADQASKLGVIHLLDLRNRGEIDVIPPLLNFRWAENRGVNFGLLSHSTDVMRWVLVVVALVISGLVIRWVRREGFGRWANISAGLLVGGAIGNVVDRIAYGYVADFLNMSCCGFENPYAFNIADIGIFAGAFGLVLFTPKNGDKTGKGQPQRRKTP